jgi:hypothetical protein
VSTTFPDGFVREMVCPLICKSMGTHDDGDDSFGPGATTAMELG